MTVLLDRVVLKMVRLLSAALAAASFVLLYAVTPDLRAEPGLDALATAVGWATAGICSLAAAFRRRP